MSSLDACGDGTVFLEYFCEEESDWISREKTLGRVYGVGTVSSLLYASFTSCAGCGLQIDQIQLMLCEHICCSRQKVNSWNLC